MNVDDFVRLARKRELHAGMILIEDAGLYRDEQIAVIRRTIAVVQSEADLVNRVLWVNLDGTMEFEDIPAG